MISRDRIRGSWPHSKSYSKCSYDAFAFFKSRKGSCFPEPPRKALTALVQEAYVRGLSTRNGDNLVRAVVNQTLQIGNANRKSLETMPASTVDLIKNPLFRFPAHVKVVSHKGGVSRQPT